MQYHIRLLWLFLGVFLIKYTCAAQQPGNVQFATPGNFVAPFDYLNNIPANGLDLNDNGAIDIITPCSCRTVSPIPNGTQANTGYFDDQLIIATGVTGQLWRVYQGAGLFHHVTLAPILPGTTVPEVGTTGIYVLRFAHRDALGYFAGVEAPAAYPNIVFGPITNTCYYPDPEIVNLDDAYCDNAPNIVLLGEATSPFDNNIFPLTPVSESWSITRLSDNANFFTQVFSPTQLGPGNYRVRYSFNAGAQPDTTSNQTGCAITVEQNVYLQSSSQSLACNTSINVALNPTSCVVNVVPELLLSGNPPVLDFYYTEVLTQNGVNLGNVIPAQYAGQTLLGVVHDECSGLFCTTNITVKDLTQPTLNAPPDITVNCYDSTDPANTGTATATDCTNVTVTYTDQWQYYTCGNPRARIYRTWKATDAAGNMRTRLQTISIARGNQSLLVFPSDVQYSCEEYQADPTITNAAADKAGLPNLVTESLCSMIYSYQDDTLQFCGNPNTSFVILRTWFVIDVCGNNFFSIDGQGNDNLQVIRVLDDSPPSISVDSVSVIATESSLFSGTGECTSLGYIPPPLVEDPCNSTTIYIYTPIGEADYVNGVDGAAGAYIPSPGLPLGNHEIIYEAVDACGNISSTTGILTVKDELPPIMICDVNLSVSLNSIGYGSLFPEDIDEGSRDECCLDSLKIKLLEEPDSLFRDRIDFYCTNDVVEVVLRATDCYGNFNECQATVDVGDRVRPFVVSGVAPNINIACSTDYSNYLNEAFNAPVFGDNCNFSVDFDVNANLDLCGIGTLTRTWTATDNPLNQPRIVTQTITIQPVHNYTMIVPEDNAVNCDALAFSDFGLLGVGCDSVEAFVTQEIFTDPGHPSCYRIRRIHQVVNWCEYDGVSAPFTLERRDGPDFDNEVGDSYTIRSNGDRIFRVLLAGEIDMGPSTGYYAYEQIIDVFDNTPAALSYDTLAPVCVNGDDCSGEINLQFTVQDDCEGEVMLLHSLNLYNSDIVTDIFGTLVDQGNGFFAIQGAYPEGDHSIFVSVFDACGNLSQFMLPFSIQDCTPPELQCLDTLVVTLSDENGFILEPETLIAQSYEDCGVIFFAFDEAGEVADITYNCDSLGLHPLEVWGFNATGQQQSCQAVVSVEAPLALCADLWKIEGHVYTEDDEGIAQARVVLTGPVAGEDTTGLDGLYAFPDLPQADGYKVEPAKNTDHDNGVTTLDLVFITRHILGTQLLSSPYKIIAADANRSGTISTQDVIAIRRVILSLDSVFSANTSWRFVPEAYQFVNPANPLTENFPESVILETLDRDTMIHFVGIKTGDVNDSADPAGALAIETRTTELPLRLQASDQWLEAGQTYRVSFAASIAIAGCQFALTWNPLELQWLGIPEAGDVPQAYWGLQRTNAGEALLSWNAAATPRQPVFEIEFLALQSMRLGSALRIAYDSRPNAEAYWWTPEGTLQAGTVVLDFVPQIPPSSTVWMAVHPNPFVESAEVTFELPVDQQVCLEIVDLAGNVLKRQIGAYSAGIHQWRIDRSGLPANGVLLCRLQSEIFSDVKKLIILDK